MSALLITLHVTVCIALIMIVLLQTGKGADMGAAFGGGGSQTLFGSTGASTFLSKATTIAAILFMLTSLGLAYMSSHKMSNSIMSDVEVETPAATDTPVPVKEKGTAVEEVSSQVIEVPVSAAKPEPAQAKEAPASSGEPVSKEPEAKPAAGNPATDDTKGTE